jgi:hypothetical protein
MLIKKKKKKMDNFISKIILVLKKMFLIDLAKIKLIKSNLSNTFKIS